MTQTDLEGLDGTNPLGFFASLGVMICYESQDLKPTIWWSADVAPHALLSAEFSIDRTVRTALETIATWKDSPTLNPRNSDGSHILKGDELKLTGKEIRNYLSYAIHGDRSERLASSLIAEGSLDNSGRAKPTDFYFTAGQQKFLAIARKILSSVTYEDLKLALSGPWLDDRELPSFGWDVRDDRMYALRAIDPSTDKKLTNPGVEALALLGLSLYPVFAGKQRTETQGCSGTWKSGIFSWPLWNQPATLNTVKSLVSHVYEHESWESRKNWYVGWGISSVMSSQIRRSDQGGYGTFGPAEIVWKRPI